MTIQRYRFPGTKPFSLTDQDIFEGRKKSIHRLYDLLQKKSMIVFYSESGLGKSSLINAGLIPLFQSSNKESYFPVKVRFLANENRIANKLGEDERVLLLKTVAQLNEANKSLASIILPFADADRSDLWHEAKKFQMNNFKLLLIFDQAEELFTYSQRQIDFFKEQLYTILSNHLPSYLNKRITSYLSSYNDQSGDVAETDKIDSDLDFIYKQLNVKILFVIREDKFGYFDLFSDFFPDILKNTYRLKPLEETEAREAILLPACAEGAFLSPKFDFTAEGIEQLLQILVEDDNTFDPYTIQLSCSYIERSLAMKGKVLIDKEDIPQKGIIEKEYFDNVWSSVPSGFLENVPLYKKILAEKLIDQDNKIRIKTYENNFLHPLVLKALVQEGLIREDHSAYEGKYYELSHDRLVKPILEFYKQQKDEEDLEKANQLYSKLLRNAVDTYELTNKETRAIEVLVEELLLNNLIRVAIDYSKVLQLPHMREDAIQYLIKEEFLLLKDGALEISEDKYVDAVAKSYRARKNKEDEEKAKVHQKRRIQIGALITVAAGIFIALYLWKSDSQQNMIKDFIKLNVANSYLDNGDLEKAYGIYGYIYNSNDYFKKQIDDKTKRLNYTDLPGNPIYALSNNRILSILDSGKTAQIWKIGLEDSISRSCVIHNKRLMALSPNRRYVGILSGQKINLYDAQTNHHSILLKSISKDIGFGFSYNSDYFSCIRDSIVWVYALTDSLKSKKYRFDQSFYKTSISDVKDIIYMSDSVIYGKIENYLARWVKNRKGIMELDVNGILKSSAIGWCSINKDSIIFLTKNGLEIKNLENNKQELLLKADLSNYTQINEVSNNILLLKTPYTDKLKKVVAGKYAHLAFYRIGDKHIYEILKDQVIDKFSISKDYEKCIVRANSKQIYLVDRIAETAKPITFFTDSIYDISDDGKYILFVKERIDDKKVAPSSGYPIENATKSLPDTSALLFLTDLKTGKYTEVDKLIADPSRIKNTTIYGKYFFRFNPNSDCIAYLRRGDKDSLSMRVRRTADLKIVYNSVGPETFLDNGRSKDFTSVFIHIQKRDTINKKAGIKLLNTRARNSQYFLSLYKRLGSNELDRELKRANALPH
ncbi:hypothetical protein [Mucilaginibacter rubeus]|uniref:Novel STAND NTPase 1 domain-containing protein n=1 Tax=Mucilaginibacter rubeus TaxID=2027860 RepID=A0A5C1I630_9SPHI|nr:hypothetical protein [Mucilaginibacter rubeus]QEM13405.1 hypothetical protein DEO27_026475 [Mucilaginibacter rubeus]